MLQRPQLQRVGPFLGGGTTTVQTAVESRVTHPDLVRDLDKPSHRTQRILLPVLAHVLGVGALDSMRITLTDLAAVFSSHWPPLVLFWLIGTDPWLDYQAVARDCLPMTLVFNLLLVRQPGAHPLWFLANVTVLDGLQRMTWP